MTEPWEHKDVNNCAQTTQTFESDVTGAASLGVVEVVGVAAVLSRLVLQLVLLYSGVATPQSSLFNPGIHVSCILQVGEHSMKCQNQYMSS